MHFKLKLKNNHKQCELVVNNKRQTKLTKKKPGKLAKKLK